MKSAIFFLIILISLPRTKARTILIDPGHGGSDEGAKTSKYAFDNKGKRVRRTIFEKDLVLSVSKKIQKKLKEKNYRVFLTRSVDRSVSLEKRASIAQKVNADLFISIHANASYQKLSGGFETYYLDNQSNLAIKKVEEVENKGSQGEDSIVNQILIDLVVKRTVESSKLLAKSIHRRVKNSLEISLKIKDRGIKPGLFFVLALSKRPGVLLEMGFLSNPKELRKIRSNVFQEEYASAVVKGVEDYFKNKDIVKKLH